MNNRITICVHFLAAILFILLSGDVVGQDPNSRPTDKNPGQVTLGIIADCQYADIPTAGVRNYSLSDQKLKQCVEDFNGLALDHVFHLGDFIDQQEESFDTVLPIVKSLNSSFTLVLGNHDFSVSDEFKDRVPGLMGLKERYFSFKIQQWKLIVLDGNDISLYAWPQGSKRHSDSKKIHETLYNERPTYNGAIGKDQMIWLKNELKQAQAASESVILLCHFPVLPEDPHVLWNSEEILELISDYSCVKAWLNGHNHAGDYAEFNGIHFVTFKGMVDTEENSYATISLLEGEMVVNGFGREENRLMKIRGQ